MDTQVASLGTPQLASPLQLSTQKRDGISDFVPDNARVRFQAEFNTGADLDPALSFEKAVPRQKIFFNPSQTTAAIITCGGICPGLNNVIRSAVNELHDNYGVRRILGLRYGYAGLNPAVGLPPMLLDPELLDHIHEHGGSILGTSRGPQPPEVMVNTLIEHKVNILICVGGDGTLRGARAIGEEALKRNIPLAVVGVPKTIDNDVMYVYRTFGVNTAIARARDIIDCAHIESKSVLHGVGLVKLMGREAGFIAAGATLASQDVNFTLIPEVPFKIENFLATLQDRLSRRKHAVVVVAEGAGQDLLANIGGTDASGNRKLADIGIFLKERMLAHFKQAQLPIDVKYFDPSYYIRSVPAGADDAILCDQLARNAVHAGMAGKTNVVVGLWNGRFTHLPIALATSGKKQIDPEGGLWASVLASTGQPQRM